MGPPHPTRSITTDTGLANSTRAQGQERAKRRLGFPQGNNPDVCLEPKDAWYITWYLGKVVSWLWTQPLRTLTPSHAALAWTSLQEGIKLRANICTFWNSTPLRNKGRRELHPDTKQQCLLQSCERTEAAVSSRFPCPQLQGHLPPFPQKSDGTSRGLASQSLCWPEGQLLAGLDAMDPVLTGTHRSRPVSVLSNGSQVGSQTWYCVHLPRGTGLMA